MKWRQPANRKVVEAVIAAFREPSASVLERFAKLSLKQWERSYYWLDASGMALYLLDRIERLNFTDALPENVLQRLRRNLADNGERVGSMWAEFVELNTLFTHAGVSFSNLKGFTLAPDSVSDLTLRCQLDFDFLIDGKDIAYCRRLLEERGYVVRGEGSNVLEFKTDCTKLATIKDLYKPKPQRCVEIHFATDAKGKPIRDSRLDKLQILSREGLCFPTLSPVDQFVGQATHLYGHLCGANTRVAWLLEFSRHMQAHDDDADFWNSVRTCAQTDKKAMLALGISSMLSADLFTVHPPAAARWMLANMPDSVMSWVSLYGRRALLADTPGTKLGLLLRNEVQRDDSCWQKQRRIALIPRHRAPRLFPADSHTHWSKRLHGEFHQLRYDLFRLRFHLVEGARFFYESFRFKYFLTRSPHNSIASQPVPYPHKSRF